MRLAEHKRFFTLPEDRARETSQGAIAAGARALSKGMRVCGLGIAGPTQMSRLLEALHHGGFEEKGRGAQSVLTSPL